MKNQEPLPIYAQRLERILDVTQLIGSSVAFAFIGNLANDLAVYDYISKAPTTRIAVEGLISLGGFTGAIYCGYEAIRTIRRPLVYS